MMVLKLGGNAVMCEQGVQERSEHTVLGDASVDNHGGECGGIRTANHSLRSLRLAMSLGGTLVLNAEL